ncbi:MAG: hydrogenase maturation protease [Actinobacteria bacterium]|nr:hydrogenase maturation protease [Actinomycetota bacterium]
MLVAGIGNVLLADDGFGVAVAQRLAQRELPAGVKVADYGIRGMDLAYELQEDYDAAILVDAVPRGAAPGTLFALEHGGPADEEAVLDVHAMTPVRVLALARALGTLPARILVVGCEPAVLLGADDAEIEMELSPPVRAALPAAVELVERLLGELLAPAAAARAAGDDEPEDRS